MFKTPELLAPAGNLEKLKMAILYGADAVYIGGKQFGLRAFADNLTLDEIKEGLDFAHARNKKVYITMNIFAHNEDFAGMEDYVRALANMGVDAIILSDPGIFSLVKSVAPNMDIHLSTQANTTNWRSILFWYKQGVSRVILARELSIDEIRHIRQNTPNDLELEAFVHGAMCISYSGRCLLSNYLTGRDSNRGKCAHTCRWKYHLMEESRPGEYFPIIEDDRGAYILNSKDLCMIEYLPLLMDAGLNSLKIEGRMKSSYYVATVVQAYRREIDLIQAKKGKYQFNCRSLDELKKASHRPFTTGFYFNKPTEEDHKYDSSSYIRGYDFIGVVLDYIPEEGLALVEQRNLFEIGDIVEIMIPGESFVQHEIKEILDENKNPIARAPHPQQHIYIPIDRQLPAYSIIRRGKKG
ncbi:MAG: U32 family peptidase [Xylanivirga thermophila]|jgi:U32 family peptidase|uniref:peptidase U32 family protein n=1 Tax=Xylanivirga thermophila TaxID=2496273 RepID=UPI00101B933E|nr:U32 family peptidase [Xylanivirga thermophila]